ncbi:MAG: translation initiation factor IF-1 [Candidatus Paceibacterota bacterium]|jgi:translation initiation factor IF-1
MKEKIEGVVIESLPGTNFLVELKDGKKILAYLSGKMRLYYIKVLPGDRVQMELSPDGQRGRVVKRL